MSTGHDEALSRLFPTIKIGNDGFNWWIGQIEARASDEGKNKGGYRYKVAIVGEHPKSKKLVPTKELPWANVVMPVTDPFTPGNIAGRHPQLIPGCWVIGFYLDADKQKPVIMGSIGQTPGAASKTKVISDGEDSRFETGPRSDPKYSVNPNTDGDPTKLDGARHVGVLSDLTKDGNDNLRVHPGNILEQQKRDDWCQENASRCKDIKLKETLTIQLGSMLKEIQDNDGNIGDFYVSKYTGGLYSGVGVSRKYVNKIVRVIREFLAKVKGFILSQIQKAVDKLIKAVLRPDQTGNSLTPVTEFFNRLLDDLGCKMEDLGLRLIEWLTNLIMSYINTIYRNAICQVDEFVNGIISKIYQLLESLLDSILGPLQDILGAIAEPLNMIGNAINYILKLLGITCSGPNTKCSKYKATCTNGNREGKDDEEDFLDKLLDKIDNLFGDTPPDYTQYVCDEAFTGKPLEVTGVGFVGGVPKPPTQSTKEPKLIYEIKDIEVKEGDKAVFTITRKGLVSIASSVNFQTLAGQGSATQGVDYFSENKIIPFGVNITEEQVEVQTVIDNESDPNESFFVKITNNSPEDGSEVKTKFVQNIAKCTIVERDLKEPYDPFSPNVVDPFKPIDDTPPEDFPADTGDSTTDGDTNPTFAVSANRSTCPEDEFIIYSITTTNIEDGSILYYTLTGEGITPSDIVGNKLTGEFVINNNASAVTVGIREDNVVEDQETLTFSINGTTASVDVLIVTKDDQSIVDFDEGLGDVPETVFEDFSLPSVISENVITDDNGGIIEIPIDDTGDAWAEPPTVFVTGEGIGATATALLNEDGFVTEIRVLSSGFGYKINRADERGVRCIIDDFTVIRPGSGYTSAPTVLVDGSPNVVEAIVNDDGFVIGVNVLDRTLTFDKFPTIEFIGGGGFGAKMIPSLVCLDTDGLSKVGSTKIGTGKYIDCP